MNNSEHQSSKTVLFINAIRPATFEALTLLKLQAGIEIRPIVLIDTKIAERLTERNGQLGHIDKVPFIAVDFDDPRSIREGIRSITSTVDGIVCQYENSVLELGKIVPYFPNLCLPTEKSLEWATEKKLMRMLLEAYDANLIPAYTEVHNLEEDTLERVEREIGYPMIIKPSGLEGALLVSLAQNRNELRSELEKGFQHVQKAYDTWIKRQKPFFLAEEFVDGDMYSIDVYVDKHGEGVCAPIVEVITGKKVGFDDFFGYVRKTPVPTEIDEEKAIEAAVNSCKALGLRSVTAHVELMRLKNGQWKIIELGPRIGGYRQDIYMHGFGINHIANDILNRMDIPTHINRRPRGYVAMFNIYARDEGTIKAIHGIDAVSQLASTVSVNQKMNVGDKAVFAKNNGDVPVEVLLFSTDKAQFDQDYTAVEELLTIEVE